MRFIDSQNACGKTSCERFFASIAVQLYPQKLLVFVLVKIFSKLFYYNKFEQLYLFSKT